jgi:coproporphyrinogen III oxidase
MVYYPNIEEKKVMAKNWFEDLRNQICSAFENIEQRNSSQHKFKRKEWHRPGGGGGEMSIMNGDIFEKVGVNVSEVYGEFSENFAKEIPGADTDRNFWASGISLVAHMKSPLIPAVHMNTRMIVTSKAWFGGGTDLTPTFPIEEDTNFFHQKIKEVCDTFDTSYYPKFKAQCDEYFYIKHRKESRGVGGIFYDLVNTNNWEKDFGFTKAVGKAFIDAFVPLVEKNMIKSWDHKQKEAQLLKRGRYVEFNLIYDRGTRFGLMTEGNIDAIFMSLPPEVKWE